MIVCSMPGCQTTAGCQCQSRAGVSDWLGQIKRDASILNVANPAYEAGRLAGLREAAEVADAPLTMSELIVADNHCDWTGFRHAFNAVMKRRKAAILALAEGGEG